LFRALLHFLVFAAIAAPGFAQVYKWVDERGVTHYGERPPQGRKASEVPHKLGTPPAPGIAREGAPPQDGALQPSQPQRDQRARENPPQPQAQAAPSRESQDARRRKEQCNQQRELLARLKQNPQLDVSGAIARQEKTVADLCKS
jgi:hypothetical protein